MSVAERETLPLAVIVLPPEIVAVIVPPAVFPAPAPPPEKLIPMGEIEVDMLTATAKASIDAVESAFTLTASATTVDWSIVAVVLLVISLTATASPMETSTDPMAAPVIETLPAPASASIVELSNALSKTSPAVVTFEPPRIAAAMAFTMVFVAVVEPMPTPTPPPPIATLTEPAKVSASIVAVASASRVTSPRASTVE